MKKALREMQTLHAGCSKAEPKTFAPPQTPFPGARDGQNVISWRWSLPLPTNPVWWGSMHTISSYRGNRPTNKQTDRGDYNTLRRSFTSMQYSKMNAHHTNITKHAHTNTRYHRTKKNHHRRRLNSYDNATCYLIES